MYAAGSPIFLTNVTFSGNVTGDGDDGGYGGAIFTFTDVTANLTNCAISNNQAGHGTTKFASRNGLGGGIMNNGTMKMDNCLVSDNAIKDFSASSGGLGGGIFNASVLTMSNCTVSGNKTDTEKGRGGGIYNNGNGLTLTNVTVTGSIGSHLRREYTVIGDVVNLASRIEQLNKRFGSQLLISGTVWEAVCEEFHSATPMGRVPVKGREAPIKIYKVA